MFSRDNNPPPSRWEWIRSATVILLVLNVIAFVVQKWLSPAWLNDRYLELSLRGITTRFFLAAVDLSIHAWKLDAFDFELLGIVCLWPRRLNGQSGKRAFCSCISPAESSADCSKCWRRCFGLNILAARLFRPWALRPLSWAVIAAFAMLFPNQRLVLLLFYVIPIKMRAKTLIWLVLLVTAFGISFPLAQLEISARRQRRALRPFGRHPDRPGFQPVLFVEIPATANPGRSKGPFFSANTCVGNHGNRGNKNSVEMSHLHGYCHHDGTGRSILHA